jgi:outer membrane protein assembly factor BamB
MASGKLYVMGWTGDHRSRDRRGLDTVFCFNAATGKQLWKQSYQCRYQGRVRTGDTGGYGGPSSTPTFDTKTGYLYTLSIDGDLQCWDASKGGRKVWSCNFYDKYQVRQRPDVGRGRRDYGYASSPLVIGNLLIMEVGDNEGTLMAFDKKMGKRSWTSACKEPAGHNAGPVPIVVQGVPCVASLGIRKLAVVRMDKGHQGQTVATFNWTTDYANNIATPAVIGNRIVLTSGYNQHKTSLLEVSLKAMRRLWSSREHSGVSSPVIYKARMYIADGSLRCLDLNTGRLRWRGGRFGHGSCLVTAGDDKLIVFGSGKLALVDASPGSKKYRELSHLDRIVKDTCYPHVALSNGIICCKDRAGSIVCFSVRK